MRGRRTTRLWAATYCRRRGERGIFLERRTVCRNLAYERISSGPISRSKPSSGLVSIVKVIASREGFGMGSVLRCRPCVQDDASLTTLYDT